MFAGRLQSGGFVFFNDLPREMVEDYLAERQSLLGRRDELLRQLGAVTDIQADDIGYRLGRLQGEMGMVDHAFYCNAGETRGYQCGIEPKFEELYAVGGGVGSVRGFSAKAGESIRRMVNPRSLIARQGRGEMTSSKIERFRRAMKENGYGDFPAIDAAVVEGRLIILDGHHRARAAVGAGLREVPVNAHSVTADEASKLLRDVAEALAP